MACRPHSCVWGPLLTRRAGRTQGQPAPAGWGRHERRLSRLVKQIGQQLTPLSLVVPAQPGPDPGAQPVEGASAAGLDQRGPDRHHLVPPLVGGGRRAAPVGAVAGLAPGRPHSRATGLRRLPAVRAAAGARTAGLGGSGPAPRAAAPPGEVPPQLALDPPAGVIHRFEVGPQASAMSGNDMPSRWQATTRLSSGDRSAFAGFLPPQQPSLRRLAHPTRHPVP